MKNYISSFFSITYHDCDKLNYNTSFFYCKCFSSRLSTKFDIVLFHPIKYTKSPQKPTHFVIFFFIFSRRFLIFFSYSSDGIIYIIIHTPKRSRLVVSALLQFQHYLTLLGSTEICEVRYCKGLFIDTIRSRYLTLLKVLVI